MNILDEDLQYINNSLTDKEHQFYKDGVILITGCAGSLAYELIYYLLKYGNVKKIIGIDNCYLGYPNWLKRLVDKNRIEFHKEDISVADLSGIDPDYEVTHIFHMASLASPVEYRDNPLLTMDANVTGCRNLLDYYKNKNLKTFCYFSSSEIYGSPDDQNIPTNESYRGNVSCVGPRACYDEAKRYSETVCWVYTHYFHMPCVILRPFNIFGPGMRLNDGRIPTDCAWAVIENRNIKIYSDGTPTRTFCYMSDAQSWILKAAAVGSFDILNIGMDQPELDISSYAELFVKTGYKVCGYTKEIQYEVSEDPDFLTDNPTRRRPDLNKSKEILGFEPKISTEEGMERFLSFLLTFKNDLSEWIW